MVGVRLAPDHVISDDVISKPRQEATPTPQPPRQPPLKLQVLPVPDLSDQTEEQV